MLRSNLSLLSRLDHATRRPILLTSLVSLCSLSLSARAERAYEAWHQIYNEGVKAGQAGNATVTDSRGNVIVAGYASAEGSPRQFYTAKYAALDGSLIWQKTLSEAGDCVANGVAVDSKDNVIVTGRVSNADGIMDYGTVKYAAADGAPIWYKRYAGPQGGADIANKVVVDHQDNVVVTGYSYGSGTQEDWFTIKYAGVDGKTTWGGAFGGIRLSGSGKGKDLPVALAVDGQNNILVAGYVTGSNGKTQYAVVRYAPADGAMTLSLAPDPQTSGDNEATALAVDSTGRFAVTGIGRAQDNSRQGYTFVYDASGTPLWSAKYESGTGNYSGGPTAIAIGPFGEVLVTGTTLVSDNAATRRITTVSYNGAALIGPVFPVWRQDSPSLDHTDQAVGLVVDGGGTVTVAGTSTDATNHAADYYVARYSGTAGDLLKDFRHDGAAGVDAPRAIAVDAFGNVSVTGVSSLPFNNTNIRYDRICTLHYGKLRLQVGDDVPGADNLVSPVPAGSKIASIATPALSDDGTMAVRVVVAKGAKRLNAILRQKSGGEGQVIAVQGQPAGAAGQGTFASFLDPVVAPDGTVAFQAKLTGVSAAESTGVWVYKGQGSERILQTGKQVPDLAAGLLVKSITEFSWRNNALVAQIELSGPGVTKKNSTMLYADHLNFGGKIVFRTGTPITIPNSNASNITAISAFQPAKDAPGQSRSVGNTVITARLTLEDGRDVVVSSNVLGAAPQTSLFSGQTGFLPDGAATLKALSLPALAGSGHRTAVLTKRVDALTSLVRQRIETSVDGSTFSQLVVTNDLAPQGEGSRFASLQDPVINETDVAFVGTLKGGGGPISQPAAIWWGASDKPAALEIVAYQGSGVPNSTGFSPQDNPNYGAFVSLALPGGGTAGPVFVAKLKGGGATVKNNLGLFAVDSTGLVRRLLRTGDDIGGVKVTAFKVLSATAGSLSVSRSFNQTGGVEALVSFKDGTNAIMHLAIP